MLNTKLKISVQKNYFEVTFFRDYKKWKAISILTIWQHQKTKKWFV